MTENRFGYMFQKFTSKTIFIWERKMDFHIIFIDLEKAYDIYQENFFR